MRFLRCRAVLWSLSLFLLCIANHCGGAGEWSEAVSSGCDLGSNSYGAACPGSKYHGKHSACAISVQFKESCSVVKAEVEARIAGQKGWKDRKRHPGTYMKI